MILIVTEPDDPHANRVEAKLRARGARPFRFDFADYPTRASLSVQLGGGRKQVLLDRGGEVIDLAECRAGWLRRPSQPRTRGRVAIPVLSRYAEEECMRSMQELVNTLQIDWLPGPLHAVRRADCKQLQLEMAMGLGLEIPPTLITSDPDRFLAFYREHGGNLIDKLPSTVMPSNLRTGRELMRFTQAVSTRDVGYARRLRHSPMLFQANVPKRFELRITVVGASVLAAEIHSQSTRRTQVDWRHYDWGHTPYRPHNLPDAVETACLAMVERLGLRFGAIDMIVTPDDRYVFLEINPNGQWMWIEDETGLPISDAICDVLMDRAAPPRASLARPPRSAHELAEVSP
jgi:hypothetical protein